MGRAMEPSGLPALLVNRRLSVPVSRHRDAGMGMRRRLCISAFGLILAACTSNPGPTSSVLSSGQGGRPTPSTASPAEPSESLPELPSEQPASTAGPLSGADLPSARDLGPGWATRVEHGDIEDGSGNGTPYQQRAVAEVGEVVVPLGCEQRTANVTPTYALQATYANGDDNAVALLLQFPDSDDAGSFAATRLTDLLACSTQPDDAFSGDPAPVERASGQGDVVRASYRLADEPDVLWRSAQWTHADRLLIIDSSADVELSRWPAGGRSR